RTPTPDAGLARRRRWSPRSATPTGTSSSAPPAPSTCPRTRRSSCGASNGVTPTGSDVASRSSAELSPTRSPATTGCPRSRTRSRSTWPRSTPRRPMPKPRTVDQVERVRRLVARCTRAELEQIAARLDEDDLALLNEIVADTLVVEADAFDRIGYRPHPGPQTELHRLPPFSEGGPWDVLVGGAMGGGKTLSLLMDCVDKSMRHPGMTAWFMRV